MMAGDENSEIDLEAQSLGGTSQSSSTAIAKPVHFNMSVPQVKEFVKDYGIQPILRTSEPYHQHPHLAYSRNTLERIALDMASDYGLVADVGSAARLVRLGKTEVHCLCPHIQPGDIARMNQAKKKTSRVCDHTLQVCTCGPFDALMFIHSAYYFDYNDLFEALMKSTHHVGFVVGHLFPEAYGHFAYKEGNWEVDFIRDQPMIITKVNGNAHSYTHKPLLWDYQVQPGDENSSIEVEQIAKIQDTYLWRITAVSRPVQHPQPKMLWEDQVVDRQHMGPITLPGHDHVSTRSSAANRLFRIEVDNLYGWGPIVYSITTQGRFYIPRGAIEEAAMKISFKPRDPALLQDVAYIMRKSISTSRLPGDLRLRAITMGTALAFNMNVQNEVNVLHTMTSRFSSLWKMHAILVSLSPIKAISLFTLIFWSLVSLAIIILLFVEVDFDHHVLGWSLLGIWGVVCIIISCKLLCTARQQARTLENWSTTLFHEQRASHITGGYGRLRNWLFPATDSLREPLLDIHGSMVVGVDEHGPKHPGKTHHAIRVGGIAFDTTAPAVPPDTVESEIVSLTHRVLGHPTLVDKTIFDRFKDLSATRAGRALLDVKIEEGRDDFERWVMKDSFTASVRQKFRKYYEDWRDLPPPPNFFSAFIKVEKNKTITVSGPPKLKPRFVSGPWDAVKAMCGPAVAKIYAAVKEAWNGKNCPLVYASGMTPDEIGRICDDFARNHGGYENLAALSVDCVTFDTTLENELLSCREWYLDMGMKLSTYEWLNSSRSAGTTKHGIHYKLGEKYLFGDDTKTPIEITRLDSGRMDTNLVGTLVNGMTAATSVADRFDYLMLLCGDDNFLLSEKQNLTPEFVQEHESNLRKFGLKPEVNMSDRRCDWEFCSKLFYYGKDPKTGLVQTVLGPKVGRWLSKIGHNLTAAGALNFRGAMLSSAQDCNHIPYIREYVRKGLQLTAGHKSKGREWSELAHVTQSYDHVDANYSLLEERYGINELHYGDFMAQLANVTALPFVLHWDPIEDMVARDEA
jgi:hypothetical protein